MANQEVVLIPMEQSDLPTLQSWFEDEELSERLGGILPLQKYFNYVAKRVKLLRMDGAGRRYTSGCGLYAG